MIRLGDAARRLGGCTKGVAAVETAIVVSLVLLPLLAGVADIGIMAQQRDKLDEALQDAITYVSAGNTGSAGVTTAAQAAYGTSIAVSTGTFCYCVATGTTTPTAPTTVNCSGSCASGDVLETFMKITVSTAATLPVPLPALNLPSPVTLTTSGYIRTS